MAAQKKPASGRKTGARTKKAGASTKELRVRMYRVGFGDFFLVTVPSREDGPQHILIDCGVTKGTSGNGDIGTIKAAVRHMAEETGGKLALIIVTHRHQDHIVGFSRCADVFKDFTVGAIWMSHWETEYDDKVMKFQAELTGLAADVHQHLAMRGASDPLAAQVMGVLANAVGAEEGPGGGSNAASLLLLKTGLNVKPVYLHRGQKPKLPKELSDAGLEAEILGPPPPDALAFMKLKDLKKGVGQFLGAAGDAGTSAPVRTAPFGKARIAKPEDYPVSAFREWAPRSNGGKPVPPERHPARVEAAIAAAQPEMLLTAAKTLDGFLNNQSLVVLFTWNGRRLLFAGDAQAGNWEYWLYDLEKPSKAGVETLTKSSDSILKNLDFYKVGHHGSTNATPIAAVAAMGDGFAAMCSTEADTFGSTDNQSEVPRVPLIEALARKCKEVVRSDHFPFDLEGKKVKAVKGGPDKPPKPARGGRYEVGAGFVDFLV